MRVVIRCLTGGFAVVGAIIGIVALSACGPGMDVHDMPAPHISVLAPTSGSRPASLSAPSIQPVPDHVEIHPDGTIVVNGRPSVVIEDDGSIAKTGPSLTRSDIANAKGSGLSVTGQEAKVDQQGQPSQVGLGSVGEGGIAGGASSGTAGGSTVSAKVMGVDQGAMTLYVMGGLAIIGGCVCVGGLGLRGMGLSLIAGGGGLIALGATCAAFPWLPPVAIGVFLAIGLVWHLHDAGKLASTSAALTSVVTGVEARAEKDRAAGQAVKDEIGMAAAQLHGPAAVTVRETIRKAKKTAGVA